MAQPLETTVPRASASSTFFAMPREMAYRAAEMSRQPGRRKVSPFSWGKKAEGRRMGPEVRVGKKKVYSR